MIEQVREWNRDASVNTCTWPWLGASGGGGRSGGVLIDREGHAEHCRWACASLTPATHPAIPASVSLSKPAPRPYGGAFGEWTWWVSVCRT